MRTLNCFATCGGSRAEQHRSRRGWLCGMRSPAYRPPRTSTVGIVMDERAQLEREREEWEALVGRAIIAFGEIELITHRWLTRSPRDAIGNVAARLPFGKRVELMLEILENRNLSEHGKKFVQSLKRAKKLGELRNEIAHNPVMLNVYFHEPSGNLLRERSIARVRGDRVIDLAEMKEFAAAVQDLASCMWLEVMNLTRGEIGPV